MASRVTGLRSAPFPLSPSSLGAAALQFTLPFVPSVAQVLERALMAVPALQQCHKHGTELQMAVRSTTPRNQLYCSCQHLTRGKPGGRGWRAWRSQVHPSFHQGSIRYFYSHFTEYTIMRWKFAIKKTA